MKRRYVFPYVKDYKPLSFTTSVGINGVKELIKDGYYDSKKSLSIEELNRMREFLSVTKFIKDAIIIYRHVKNKRKHIPVYASKGKRT